MHIAYFVHNLADAAVAKRTRMLLRAGADVRLFGFRRTGEPISQVAGAPAVDLGVTADAKLMARAGSVARALIRAGSWARHLDGADVVMARNLEVLVLAALARSLHAPRARLAYECLDVHRLMVGPGPVSAGLRGLEGALLRASDLLIVSSPAFLREYFEPYQKIGAMRGLASLVVENKTLGGPPQPAPPHPPAGPPWRIGWFGMIRCRRSLDMLSDLARRRPDLLQVLIRGRPSYTEFEDFDRQVQQSPNLVFGGPYQAQDVPALYGQVHFNWSIDYFEDWGNSRWLLPNRLYEGGRCGVPALAQRGFETGRWLEKRGLGVLFDDPASELEGFLDSLTPERYADLIERHGRVPQSHFTAGPADCDALAAALKGARLHASCRPRPGLNAMGSA